MPGGHDLGDFDDFAAIAQGETHDPFDGDEEGEVGQAADHSDGSGQEKVDGFVADAEAFADGERALPMLSKER